ncbi:hypothetical protein AXK11_03250 [Cephaloticoccus primus]|uniref:Phosphate transport system permease protein n=1 Tax=Cephaloticoccus primus TaxID=1548207 RepID=A0A139SQE0_9BACT|nr:phosphate ABC transporter permease subunit PstC [Cephaloticoccus primus]KXU36825.1 hypothetical protein AXK11_03250 [Cephaloticoccus primus]
MPHRLPSENSPDFSIRQRHRRIFGLTREDAIRAFFGGHAVVAVVVLALITLFLFREGIGFFAQQRESFTRYRQSGQELVDLLREQDRAHAALGRELGELRLRMGAAGAAEFADYEERFADAALPLRELAGELGDIALEAKESATAATRLETVAQLVAQYPQIEKTFVELAAEVNTLAAEWGKLTEASPAANLGAGAAPKNGPPARAREMVYAQKRLRAYVAALPVALEEIRSWSATRPVSQWQVVKSFFFGPQWLTASFWQDFYGVVPLFTGSLLVSAIALCLAVPLGLGAAVYVSQIATARERRLIKPVIEFIAAIPSVVLGLFGIVVLGQLLRSLSQVPWLAWVPGFPYAERLNALTAGCLLALIAVPTIFTLAEDALGNVPRAFKEGSCALGASPMQTTWRVIVPSSLSGLCSAVLLGLGRVIGETMVVLLCAGNRIAIPDFTAGLGAAVQPVHTMTGIIAQEMGEVVPGTIHYRALFMVGLLLFLIALALNYTAQRLLARYRLPTL